MSIFTSRPYLFFLVVAYAVLAAVEAALEPDTWAIIYYVMACWFFFLYSRLPDDEGAAA